MWNTGANTPVCDLALVPIHQRGESILKLYFIFERLCYAF